jgi:hypothetical protein
VTSAVRVAYDVRKLASHVLDIATLINLRSFSEFRRSLLILAVASAEEAGNQVQSEMSTPV